MALFGTTNVTLALDILRVWSADDRWGGVEPYVVPIFFKVDGERYLASLRINHSQQPREGTTEQEAGEIQISVDTVATGTSPSDPQPMIKEDNPMVWATPGDLLTRGSLDSGDQVIMRDVSTTRNLMPIPFRIDVRGTYVSAAEALDGLLVPIAGAIEDAINFVFTGVDDFIGGLFGLDEVLESCPATDFGSGGLLNDIDAQFKAIIPGTIGGVFLCMENDAFDEDIVSDLRASLKDEVASVINDTINGLNQNNLIPETDRFLDTGAITDEITSDLTWSVIGDVGVSIGAIVAGALSLNAALALYGILTGLSWAIGGKDDTIGVVTVTFDQSDLDPAGGIILRSQILDPEDDNRWELSYTMTVNSMS